MSISTSDEEILSFRLNNNNGSDGESSIELVNEENITVIDLNTQIEQHELDNTRDRTINVSGRRRCKCLKCGDKLLDEYLKSVLSNKPLDKCVQEASRRVCLNAENEDETDDVDDLDLEERRVVRDFLQNQLEKG
ncbi:unnamed protein product [Hermetia illucens]|uniref:Uncharacterized protein n=1 Tax=Hermetia illucens TaxID=343691 RepID=A0A7R8UI49_HERIL|nr:uncharacterized protein LOC119649214 [Hermetia illucens]CAD7081313.1 unnamed protein product [Hermetia illucens]